MKESASVLKHLLGVCNGQHVVNMDHGDGCYNLLFLSPPSPTPQLHLVSSHFRQYLLLVLTSTLTSSRPCLVLVLTLSSSLYLPKYSLSWTLYLSLSGCPFFPDFYLDPCVSPVSFFSSPSSFLNLYPLVSYLALISTCSLTLDHVFSVFFSHHGHPSLGSLIFPCLPFLSCIYTAWSMLVSSLVLISLHL